MLVSKNPHHPSNFSSFLHWPKNQLRDLQILPANSALAYVPLEDRHTIDVTISKFFLLCLKMEEN